jgi:uncharacterized damage-inducible protein DinB
MPALFKEIFEYHNHFNQLLLDEFKKHEGKLPARTYPLFCHVINAHQIWNARILNEPTIGVRDVHTIETCRTLDNTNYLNTLQILDAIPLDKEINYVTSKQEPFTNVVRDILFHVANHSTHHKGQIISDFRQSGIEPIITDYIFYKR